MTGLNWPSELGERTPEQQRTRNRDFSVTLGKTTDQLETELDRLDPDDWRCSIGNQHTKSNGLPLHNATPADPAFVLEWSKDGEQFAVGCDSYSRLRDNVREVYLWFHETRMRSQRTVSTGDTEFAAARLPPADDEVVSAPPARTANDFHKQPHEVLGIEPDANEKAVHDAARTLLKDDHPDHGGTGDVIQTVQWARDTMLDRGDD